MSLIAGNLGIMQRLLDEHELMWGVYAGAAAHIYGNRRPIKNIDILVPNGQIRTVVECMQKAKRVVQFDGRRIMWSGINIADNLNVQRTDGTYHFSMDAAMVEHLRRMPLLGSRVFILAPEDVLVHKLLMERGVDHAEKDQSDAAAIAGKQQFDAEYIEQRLKVINATDTLLPRLREIGVTI